MIKTFQKFFVSFAMFFLVFKAGAESFEFINKDLSEILYAVSVYKGFPVTGDDTVKGTGDFRVSGDDFDLAFDSFLRKSRLYVTKSSEGWTVSRYSLVKNEEGLYSLDALDMTPSQLFEKTAEKTQTCITFDSLPAVCVSIHTGFCTEFELVSRITGLCSGFEAEKKGDGVIHVSRTTKNPVQTLTGRAVFSVTAGQYWNCDVSGCSLESALDRLFKDAGVQFCIVSGGDGKIVRASLSNLSLEELAVNLCALAGAEAVFEDGICYVIGSKNARKKIDSTGKEWRKGVLKYGSFEGFSTAALKRFPDLELVKAGGNGDFLYFIREKDEPDFDDFLYSWDVKTNARLVQLRHLKASDFISCPPPFADRSKITDSGKGDSFYFTGTDYEYIRLLEELKEYDRPVTRVSYDLLIIQYQNSKGSEWNPSLTVSKAAETDENSLTAALGSVLDFNMDVTGAFGLKFAAALQTSINETKARVFADTTLTGVSGRTISFQNTNTYRYRDNNLDPETGKPVYSGVTREIVSGLKLEITGTVIGDKSITTKISASVSRQGTDTSSKTGNPPPSSEKLVSTEVRAKSGEPVILSGLVQNEESETDSRIPWISKVPLLGRLFKGSDKKTEATELVIYLVPNIDSPETDFQKNEDGVLNEKIRSEEKKEEMRRVLKEFKLI